METTESPLDVLSRAAVMLQRNVLPPPSYDEARSLCSQQTSRKCKSPLKYTKPVVHEVSITNPASTLTYDQIGSNLSTHNRNDSSGKWKREKKHQQNKIAAASALASILSDHKKSNKYSRSNSSGSTSIENGSEPLDMSKRSSKKERGEPPSYFQSMMNSNFTRQRSDISPVVIRPSDESSSDGEAMCDDVVNEHFRRSLGEDYVNVFSNKKHDNQMVDNQASSEEAEHGDVNERPAEGLSVDDHFAKALGDTWIKLQRQENRASNQNSCKLNDRRKKEK